MAIIDNALVDTRLVLTALGFGPLDLTATCDCCDRDSLYIDTYIHNGELKRYCPVCAQVFAINRQDITPTMALYDNILPAPYSIPDAVM